jgi:hypothetical protein
MLAQHSQIGLPPECGFIQWWHNKYSDWNAADAASEERISEFVEDVHTSKKIETWKLNFEELKRLIQREAPARYSDLCMCVVKQFSAQSGKIPTYLGDKNNYYVHHLELIRSLYPNAKFLAVMRDGRDVACSYRKIKTLETTSPYKPKLPYEVSDIANDWKQNNRKVQQFVADVGADQALWIRYEDILKNPEQKMREVCHFLALEFEVDMIEYYSSTSPHQKVPKKMLDWKMKTLRKPDAANVNKYKSRLTTEQIQTFEDIAGELLTEFGYELDG